VKSVKYILVVDDNPIYTKIIENYLSKLGHIIFYLDNGEKALEAIKIFDFDLVLCDIHMPIMNGIEFCILVNELPRKPNIIMYSDSEIIYFPTDINFDYYINKRLTPKEIEDFISEFL
jgi:CheY-like chemotaxis protein